MWQWRRDCVLRVPNCNLTRGGLPISNHHKRIEKEQVQPKRAEFWKSRRRKEMPLIEIIHTICTKKSMLTDERFRLCMYTQKTRKLDIRNQSKQHPSQGQNQNNGTRNLSLIQHEERGSFSFSKVVTSMELHLSL